MKLLAAGAIVLLLLIFAVPCTAKDARGLQNDS